MADERIHRVRNIDALSDEQRGTADGFTYALPRTLITITLPIKRIRTSKAILADHEMAEECAKELGIHLQTETTLFYGLAADGVELGTDVVADPGAVYLVDQDQNKDAELLTTLTDLGVVTSAIAQVERKSLLADIIKVVFGIAAHAFPLLHSRGADRGTPTDQRTEPEKVRNKIYELRGQRQALVAGTAAGARGLPAATLELMLKELSAIEAGLLNTFTGVKEIELWKAQFELFPRQQDVHERRWSSPLLSLWPTGVQPTVDAPRGRLLNPPPPDWLAAPGNFTPDLSGPRHIACEFEADEEQVAATIARLARLSNSENSEDRSFHYRVAATGRAVISETTAATQLIFRRVQIAQLGKTFSLPRYEIDKRGRYEVEWYERLGGLKKLRVQNESHGAEGIKAIGEGVETVLGAIDESTRLKREVDILELKKKKRDLEEELMTTSDRAASPVAFT